MQSQKTQVSFNTGRGVGDRKMSDSYKLKFAFASKAARTEYTDLPEKVQDEFGANLRAIQYGEEPILPIKHLSSTVGQGVIELIINGSPAFRCLYITKLADTVFVLHSFTKTTNGTDKPAMELAKKRLKELKDELNKSVI